MHSNQNDQEDQIISEDVNHIENMTESTSSDVIEDESHVSLDENAKQENIRKPKRQYDRKYNEMNQKLDALINTVSSLLSPKSNNSEEEGVADPFAPQFKYQKGSVAEQIFTIEKNRQEHMNELKNNQMRAEYDELIKTVEVDIEDAKENLPGFLESFNILNNPNTGVNNIMSSEIFASSIPIKMIQHLGKNPKEMQRIKSLPIHLQRREMIALENSLKTNPKLTSKAPPPIGQLTPQRNKGSSYESLSIADRRAQLLKEMRR